MEITPMSHAGVILGISDLEIELYRFQNLLGISLGAVVLSLLPLLLSAYEISDAWIWRIACTCMAVFAFGFLVIRWPIAARMQRDAPADRYSRPTGLAFAVILISVSLLQLCGIIGLFSIGIAIYLTGLFATLCLAALQFAVLALSRLTAAR
jgi:hypothetical protein